MPVKKRVEATETKKITVKKVLTNLLIGAIIGAVVMLVVDKFRVHQVICQIVGGDAEASVVAARCLIK